MIEFIYTVNDMICYLMIPSQEIFKFLLMFMQCHL